jgi:hypothetical protein
MNGMLLTAAMLMATGADAAQGEGVLSREVCPAKSWVANRAAVEDFLRSAEVVGVEDVDWGVLNPKKVTLRKGPVQLDAAFKYYTGRNPRTGMWESWEAEIVAYELDKLLELDMVPPTVEKRVSGKRGSVQLWVEDCRLWNDVQGAPAGRADWGEFVARMKLFDNLIRNTDRNGQNILIDADWHPVLIDHSQTLNGGDLLEGDELPSHFDRALVERVRALSYDGLKPRLGDLIRDGQIKDIVKRRDKLMEYLDQLVAERGETAVYY